MTVSPAGDFTPVLDKMRDLVAATAKFQAWTGAGSAAAAKASTHITAVNDPADKYPLAIVDLAALSADKVGSSVEFDLLMTIDVTLARTAASMGLSTAADERITFKNDIGLIFSQARALQAGDQGAYPAIVGVEALDWALPDSDNAEAGERLYGATIAYTVKGYSG